MSKNKVSEETRRQKTYYKQSFGIFRIAGRLCTQTHESSQHKQASNSEPSAGHTGTSADLERG
jgi:hypothetical protein